MIAKSAPDVPNDIEQALLTVLQLQQKAREAANMAELKFVVLNQTKSLFDYEQAVLWDAARQEVCGASAVTSIDAKAPFSQWVARLSAEVARQEQAQSVHRVELTQFAASDQLAADSAFSKVVVWVPLMNRADELMAGLWLFRSQPLSLREKRLLTFWAEQAGFVWQTLSKQGRVSVLPRWRGKKTLWLGAALCSVLLLCPVRQSVLAPAEVVSASPMTVRMPLDGVISQLRVRPNSVVKKGDVLLELDSQSLDDQLAQVRQQLSIASAELRLAQQQSFYDASRKASLAILEGKQALARLQLDYLLQKVGQTRLIAGQDGIVLFDDQGDWVGRPVRLGEPILDIADPNQTAIKILLAVDDRMTLSDGDDVRFFLNSRPTDAIDAQLTRIAYRSTLQNDGQYAFELKADMDSAATPLTMGLKGVAKIYGQRTTLFYYLLRRPLSHLRLWWGGL